MLFSPFSSPRRLALLAVLILFTIALLLRNSQYSQRVPAPAFTGSKPIPHEGSPNSRPDKPWKDDGHDSALVPNPDDNLVAAKPQSTQDITTIPKQIDLPTHAPAKPKNYMDDKITPVRHLPFEEQQNKIKDLIKWQPLNTGGHWPSWDAYGNSDYDPNRWEGFEW